MVCGVTYMSGRASTTLWPSTASVLRNAFFLRPNCMQVMCVICIASTSLVVHVVVRVALDVLNVVVLLEAAASPAMT